MIDVNAFMERADLLLEQGRHKDAESFLKQVLQQEPENDEALALLSRSYINSGRYDEGIEVILSAIALEPNNSFYFYLLAFGYYRKDQLFAAIENLRKAIELNPYQAEYFGLLAHVHIAEREFEVALEKANEGLALDAESITCLNARSIALNKLKRTEAAIETMQNALAQDPDNEVTHTTVGWNYLEKGRHKEAAGHFMEALRIDPNFNNAKAGLKEALKSKILPYKLMLQYGFWINNQGKGLQKAMPFIIYAVFRILVLVFESNDNTAGLGWMVGGLYILFVVTSWVINPIANFFLLFHRVGKHALTHNERWAALTSVPFLILGLAILAVSSFTDVVKGTSYENMFLPGMICISLALPLSQISYPIHFANKQWKEWYTLALAGAGILSLLLFIIAPAVVLPLAVIYGVAFIIYTWAVA